MEGWRDGGLPPSFPPSFLPSLLVLSAPKPRLYLRRAMSASARVSKEQPALAGIMPRVTQEMPMVSLELGEKLVYDQVGLHREVLLWQRWVRLLALATLIVLSLIFGSAIQDSIFP